MSGPQNGLMTSLDFPNPNLTQEKLKPAAVLIPVIEKEGKLHILLTKRTDKVAHHKGQICFPGGMKEDDDTSLWHTALRETAEEIGIAAHHIHYVSKLPKHITPSLFEVTPYIAFVHTLGELEPNPNEIDDIILVPIEHLLDESNVRFEKRMYFDQLCTVPFYQFENHIIWGITGIIIQHMMATWNR